jgi:hypothetical protein
MTPEQILGVLMVYCGFVGLLMTFLPKRNGAAYKWVRRILAAALVVAISILIVVLIS